MVSKANQIRCIGVHCTPRHTSHDRRTRPIHREYDDRIHALPKTDDSRIRANWKFTFAPTCVGHCRSCGIDDQRPIPAFDVTSPPDNSAQTPAQLWMGLSKFLNIARRSTHPTMANPALAAAAKQTTGTVLEAIFKFWIGDNFRIEGEWHEALDVYRSILRDGQEFTFLGHPIVPRVLECVSECHAQMGAVNDAIEALVAVTRTPRPDTALSYTWHKIGTMLEQDGQMERAKVAFSKAAHASDARPIPGGRWKDLAQRAMLQMDGDHSGCRSNQSEAVRALKAAIKQRNELAIRALASETHFHVGGATCDRCLTEGPGYMNAFLEDLRASTNVTVREEPSLPSATKQMLLSHGWEGKTFWGTLLFTIEKSPYGWSWTGVSVTVPTPGLQRLHQQQYGIAAKEGNQDMQIVIKAPWPAGTQNFAAGGFETFLKTYIDVFFILGAAFWAPLLVVLLSALPGLIILGAVLAVQLALVLGALIEGFQRYSRGDNWDANITLGLAAAALVGPWIAFWFASLNPCGFGVRGFYYGNTPTHLRFPNGEDSYYAIDFIRNAQGLPFVNSAVNERILAVADGIIVAGNLLDPPDSHLNGNFLEIIHVDRSQFNELDTIFRNDGTLSADSGAGLISQQGTLNAQVSRGRLASALLARQAGTRGRVASAHVGQEPPTNLTPGTARARPPSDPRGTIDPDNLPNNGPRDPSGRPTIPPRRERPDPATHVDPSTLTFTGDPRGPGFHFEPRQLEPLLADPDSPTGTITSPIDDSVTEVPSIPNFGRYSSRYRHMQPRGLVSLFQYVLMGTPIAQIGSTGYSASPHLHFEMHDRDCPQQGTIDPLGASIKPSPMDVDEDGRPQLLDEGDEGRCVHSTNAIDQSPARLPL